MDDLLREFLIETGDGLDSVDAQLLRLEREPNNAEILANVFRLVHTIKGSCGFIGLPRLEALAHAAENLMSGFRAGIPITVDAVSLILAAIDRIKEIIAALEIEQSEPGGDDSDLIERIEQMVESADAAADVRARLEAELDRLGPPARSLVALNDEPLDRAGDDAPSQSLRIGLPALDRLMTIVSELVLTRNQLLDLARHDRRSEFKGPLQRLSAVTSELQDGVLKTRMQPIGNAWQKLPRIVRDLSLDLDKDIRLHMIGGETELDRQVLDQIRDPLTHLVRNAVDHGLETPSERARAGKPARGSIRLTARHEGGHILLELSDDGRGLNTARILSKAIAIGLVAPQDAERLSEEQIHKLIFMPGFSTASDVTVISGRGVGLDVVRSNLEQMGGSVDVKSTPGAGVVFTLKIPLTLAIIPALIVSASGQRYAIPQLAVREIVSLDTDMDGGVQNIDRLHLLRRRGNLIPMAPLAEILRQPIDAHAAKPLAVVIQANGRHFGIAVDHVLQTEEIVVKPLTSHLRQIRAFSGNTILGDGAVVLIVDPAGIGEMLGVEAGSSEPDAVQTETVPTTPLLLFRAGGPQQKAVPLSLVARLEEVKSDAIETVGGREVIQHRGRLLPLARFGGSVARHKQPVLIFSQRDRAMALAIDEILDVVELPLAMQLASDVPGIVGTAIVRGHATEIIDAAYFLPDLVDHQLLLTSGERAA